jgi:hypothetical protein
MREAVAVLEPIRDDVVVIGAVAVQVALDGLHRGRNVPMQCWLDHHSSSPCVLSMDLAYIRISSGFLQGDHACMV